MSPPDDVTELRRIAEYFTARRALRRMGWGGIVFGIINVGIGTAFAVHLHPVNAALALIGLLLLASGVWCLLLPGAEGVITNGLALIMVGLWNVLITLLSMASPAPQVWWAVFGAFQIAAAVQDFQKYARFSAALRHGAAKDDLAMMNKLVKTILKADAKKDESIVGLQVKAFRQQKAWRGQLGRDAAIFVEKASKEVLVGRRAEVSIEPHGKVLLGSTLKATVKIGDHWWDALISPTSFDRFREWKFRADEGADSHEGGSVAGGCDPETGIQMPGGRTEISWTNIREGKGDSEEAPS